ncbi:MAG: hypothetical protein NVSMB5_10710 [Candidatus Velthaea sp.]
MVTAGLFSMTAGPALAAAAGAAPAAYQPPTTGLGNVHMQTSCRPALAQKFDLALALLHNFWYARALQAFNEISTADPQCAMAYWGAAMTYNHPVWDAPTAADEAAAWGYVQKGLAATEKSPREAMYLNAVAALYRDGGAGKKADRDLAYADAMAAAYAKFPDVETTLFYALSVYGSIPEGAKGFEKIDKAAALLNKVYAVAPAHPGILHYLIHVNDDPVHAQQGLVAARAYASSAAAVPHAQHMPSHIFTRLGLWSEQAATNENAWHTSEADVKRAGESGAYRDFHSLNYLQYAYLQLGRFKDAKWATDVIGKQYADTVDKTTAPDTPLLEARHVRGRTIYAQPDRVAYGYFDMLTRYIVETKDWAQADSIPLVAPSRDFKAMKFQIQTMAAAKRGDAASAQTYANQVAALASEPNQQPFAQQILLMQAKEAAASAAMAAGNGDKAVAFMNEAIGIENGIDSLSQPPYPIVPANELLGDMLLAMHKPADAQAHYVAALKRTPGRAMAVYGIAQAAEMLGDKATAVQRYGQFIAQWKNADAGLQPMAVAERYVATTKLSTR